MANGDGTMDDHAKQDIDDLRVSGTRLFGDETENRTRATRKVTMTSKVVCMTADQFHKLTRLGLEQVWPEYGGGIKTDARTGVDYEHGQDDFQLYQDEVKSKDGIGDFRGTGDNHHQSENKAGTRIDQDGSETDLVKKNHSISNTVFCCFSDIIAMVPKKSPTVSI